MDEINIEEWNMAKAYFMRIDQILTSCCIAQMKEDYISYYKALYRLYVEIQAKMNEEQKKEAKELLDILTYVKNEGTKTKKRVSFAPFIDFELFLRQILEDKNLMSPKKDLRGL